jgi:hypothetical protein
VGFYCSIDIRPAIVDFPSLVKSGQLTHHCHQTSNGIANVSVKLLLGLFSTSDMSVSSSPTTCKIKAMVTIEPQVAIGQGDEEGVPCESLANNQVFLLLPCPSACVSSLYLLNAIIN